MQILYHHRAQFIVCSWRCLMKYNTAFFFFLLCNFFVCRRLTSSPEFCLRLTYSRRPFSFLFFCSNLVLPWYAVGKWLATLVANTNTPTRFAGCELGSHAHFWEPQGNVTGKTCKLRRRPRTLRPDVNWPGESANIKVAHVCYILFNLITCHILRKNHR